MGSADVSLKPVDFDPFSGSGPGTAPTPIGPIRTVAQAAAASALTPEEEAADEADARSPSSKAELQRELGRKDLPPGAKPILEQEYKKNFGEEPSVVPGAQNFAQTQNRGNAIATELKARKGPQQTEAGPAPAVELKPIDYDPFAEEEGFGRKLVRAATGGISSALKGLGDSAKAMVSRETGTAEEPEDFAKPLTWGDLLHPTEAIPKAVYQLAKGFPVLTAGAAGAVAGEAAMPETGPVGPIAGGAAAAGAMSAAQALGSRFSEEMKAHPGDPNAAFSRALEKAGTDGAFTTVGWMAFGWAPFEGMVKNLLFQAFGVQPAMGAVEQASENVAAGKPKTEGIAESYPGQVVGTLIPILGFHAARMIAGGHGEATESPTIPEPESTIGPSGTSEAVSAASPPPIAGLLPPGQQPVKVVFPDGSVINNAQELDHYLQRVPETQRASVRARLMGLGEQEAEAPHGPVLQPIDQARVDAQTLKSGGDLQGADETRLKNATLLSVYGENAAVRHVIEAPEQFGAIGNAMLMAAPTVERVRGTIASQPGKRDVTNDILGAINEIAQVKAEGGDLAKIMAEGVSHDISYEGQRLAHFLNENHENPAKIATFLERYLDQVEQTTGVPSEVRGRAFDIIEEQRLARKKADEEAAAALKEETEAKQKKTEEFKAREENVEQKANLELLRAKASGSGVNPEHRTAMQLAFENAKPLKGKQNATTQKPRTASAGGVQGAKAGGAENRNAEPQRSAAVHANALPKLHEPDDQGNARPSDKTLNRGGTEGTRLNRGEQIAAERKAASTSISVPQRLFVQRGNERFEVGSLKEAARKWDEFRQRAIRQGAGGDDIGGGAKIVDQSGKEVARISQNGRVWPPGEWKSGQKPLMEAVYNRPEDIGTGERTNPVQVSKPAHVELAADRAAELPSPAQIDADNFRKGHFQYAEGHPLRDLGVVSIETAKGVKRVDKDGKWTSPPLTAHYGHLQVAEGAEGDKADITIGDHLAAKKVYVIDQIDPETGKFDETKSFASFPSKETAVRAYKDSFSDDASKRIGAVTEMPNEQFVQLARSDNLKKPVAYKEPVERAAPELKVEDIPADMKIAVPIEETGKVVELNARKAFRETRKRVNRLQSLLDCLGVT